MHSDFGSTNPILFPSLILIFYSVSLVVIPFSADPRRALSLQ
jgi:hypothetical protein